MTDDPTPNDIALLREAMIAMGRMIPGVILDDRVSNAFLANLPEEMSHYSLHRVPGQHDGAAGEQFAENAKNSTEQARAEGNTVTIKGAVRDRVLPLDSLGELERLIRGGARIIAVSYATPSGADALGDRL